MKIAVCMLKGGTAFFHCDELGRLFYGTLFSSPMVLQVLQKCYILADTTNKRR